MDERLPYQVLTGDPDDATFSERVSQALADGYVLHGGPAMAFDGERLVVAQAVQRATGFDAQVLPA